MKEHPILFSGEMVRAIITGKKLRTRRVVSSRNTKVDEGEKINPLHLQAGCWCLWSSNIGGGLTFQAAIHKLRSPLPEALFPRVYPQDRLWVKETFKAIPGIHRPAGYYVPGSRFYGRDYYFRADNDDPLWADNPWRPSIFMPRSVSRLTLEVTSVWPERLQDISEDEARLEGVTVDSIEESVCKDNLYRGAFRDLWNRINGKKHPWESNPWVWVYAFKLIENKTALKEAA